jgi:hypothetical protein
MLPEGMMTAEEKMPIDDRFKYLHRVKRRYAQADRKERGRLLDEMEAMTCLHHDYSWPVARSIGQSQARPYTH